MVATQNAGGDPGIFQPLLLRTCESELILLVELIGNVAGMEDIFDIQVILFVDDPAHHIIGTGGKFHGRSGVVIGYERDLAICHHAHIGAALGGVDLHQRTLYGNLQVHALVVLQIADAIPEVAGNQGFGVALTLLIQVKAPQGIAQTVLGGEDVDGHLVRDGVGGTEFRQGWESLIICPLG